MLLKRADVTVQSFLWADKAQGGWGGLFPPPPPLLCGGGGSSRRDEIKML